MNTPFYPWYKARFWSAYLIHMRPYLLFVSGAAGWTGIALGARADTPAYALIAAFIPLFLGYGFGQAFTDCFQIDTDRISAPYRPLSQGIVSARSIAVVSITGLILGVGLLVYLNPWNGIAGVLTVTGLATYTYFKRNYWFAGPPYNAWIVALLPVMGFLAVQQGPIAPQMSTLAPVLAMSFFAYANFVLMGYLKDITADRQSGYSTFSVVFGWAATVRTGHVLALLGAFWGWWLVFPQPAPLLVWAVGTFLAIRGQWYAHTTTDHTESNAAGPIVATVRSFVWWHLAVIVLVQPDWWPGVLVFYLLFEWALWKRPAAGQI